MSRTNGSDDEKPASAGNGSVTLAGAAFVAAATLLGALTDIQTLLGSNRAALRQAVVVLGALAGIALVIGLLRHFEIVSRDGLRKLQPFLIFGFFLAVAVVAVNWWKEDSRGTPVTLYNKVTNGPAEMRDSGIGYLSAQPVTSCARNDCQVAGPNLPSGTVVWASCRQEGDLVFNHDTRSAADDRNPEAAQSNLWYRVTDDDGNTGFLSEIWVVKDQRGGLNLPDC